MTTRELRLQKSCAPQAGRAGTNRHERCWCALALALACIADTLNSLSPRE